MRFTLGLAAVAALAVGACKKKTAAVSTVGSGSSGSADATGSAVAGSGTTGSGSAVAGSAAQAVPPADAAIGPWRIPAGATAGSGDADASALGNAVSLHFVEQIPATAAGDHREVKLVLVLEGSGKAVVADETGAYAQDSSKTAMTVKTATDVVLAPLSPPRPFQASDQADYPLDFKGPLLYLAHLTAKAEKRLVAVAHDADTLVVWTLLIASDAVDVAPDWEKTGTIKLAPGATVTAAGSGS